MTRPAFDFYWEDFPVGREFVTGRHLFTEEEMKSFARQYDTQRFHVDPAAARETMFGGLIASGWHTCALAMRLMCDAYLARSACLGSPGLDSLKWLKPVRAGDEITYRAKVLVSRPSSSKPGIGLTKFLWDAVNADGETVLAMDGWQLFERREKDQR